MKPFVRPIDPGSVAEVGFVARRMRQTLIEVLGEARGGDMYTLAWLRQRVRFHCDTEQCTGEVFLAEDEAGDIVGHCIVRIESDGGERFGLFSTTWVQPEARRRGVARALLDAGEAWMRSHGLTEVRTYTSSTNDRLIRLFQSRCYTVTMEQSEMVAMARAIES